MKRLTNFLTPKGYIALALCLGLALAVLVRRDVSGLLIFAMGLLGVLSVIWDRVSRDRGPR